jgi:hypothetical protein
METAHPPRFRQSGAITLVLITALIVVAMAATVSGGQRVWLDRLSTRNLYEREQAHWVAEAGLQWGARALQQIHTTGQLLWPAAQQSPCPSVLQGPGHECLRWIAPPPAGAELYTLTVWAMRDVREHPHVAQLLAHAQDPDGYAHAWLSHSLHLPVLGQAGSLAFGGTVQDSCASALPAWWTGLLGQLDASTLQAWSQLQQQAGLSASSLPPRNVYWVSTPGDWLTPLGTASKPVLLVFDATACTPTCPAIQAPVHGTVLYLPQCRKEAITSMTPSSASVQGQVAVQALLAPPGLSVQNDSSVRAVYALPHASTSLTQVQWIAGSWRDASP